MSTERPREQWWLCCWGHVFAHPPVPEGEELSCPVPDDGDACGTTCIYAPFDTEQAARADLDNSAPRRPGPRWAPWVT